MASSSIPSSLMIAATTVGVFVLILLAAMRVARDSALTPTGGRNSQAPADRAPARVMMPPQSWPSSGVTYHQRAIAADSLDTGKSSLTLRPRLGRVPSIAIGALRLALGLTVALVIVVVITVNGAGVLGRQPIVLTGSSMEPAIAKGALVLLRPIAATQVRMGDVVTVRANSGVLYTHRVVAIADSGNGPLFQLKGDANASADPSFAAAERIVGTADVHVPVVGYVWAVIASSSGLVGLACMLTSLYCATQLVARVSRGSEPERRTRRFAPAPIAVLALVVLASGSTVSSNALFSEADDAASTFTTAVSFP